MDPISLWSEARNQTSVHPHGRATPTLNWGRPLSERRGQEEALRGEGTVPVEGKMEFEAPRIWSGSGWHPEPGAESSLLGVRVRVRVRHGSCGSDEPLSAYTCRCTAPGGRQGATLPFSRAAWARAVSVAAVD